MDAGVVVVNMASVKAIADAFYTGEPLLRRVVTVTGAVNNPKNLLVRLGVSAVSYTHLDVYKRQDV